MGREEGGFLKFRNKRIYKKKKKKSGQESTPSTREPGFKSWWCLCKPFTEYPCAFCINWEHSFHHNLTHPVRVQEWPLITSHQNHNLGQHTVTIEQVGAATNITASIN